MHAGVGGWVDGSWRESESERVECKRMDLAWRGVAEEREEGDRQGDATLGTRRKGGSASAELLSKG